MPPGFLSIHWTWFGSGAARANADQRAPAHCVVLPDGDNAGDTKIVGMTTLCKKIVPPGASGNFFWRQRECAVCTKALAKLKAERQATDPLDSIFGKARAHDDDTAGTSDHNRRI